MWGFELRISGLELEVQGLRVKGFKHSGSWMFSFIHSKTASFLGGLLGSPGVLKTH